MLLIFFAESSQAAFTSHLLRGFGLEFDFNLTSDQEIVVFHDSDLRRITGGANLSKFADLTRAEVEALRFAKGDSLYFMDDLLTAIENSVAPISSLHIKGKFQTDTKYLDILLACLTRHESLLDRLIVFDVTVKTARYLKTHLKAINLAPSVAHAYDIKRYNDCVLGTLLSIEEVLANRDLFTWVWLDEWDLSDEAGVQKKFYTAEVFKSFRDAGLKIALVTPEMHASSPGLLGAEAHPDGAADHLATRLEEIIKLGPEAICTDRPTEVQVIINSL